ncbi:MAG: hypothetical protein ACTHMI_13310 [Mucilaginibacter sp.]
MKGLIHIFSFAFAIWISTSSCNTYYIASSIQPTDLYSDYEATQLAYNLPVGTVLLLKGQPRNGFIQARYHSYSNWFWLNYSNVTLIPGADPKQYSTSYSTYETSYKAGNGYDATIQTGSRGGKYYINKNGKKTYVKRSTPSGSTKHIGGRGSRGGRH